MNHIRQPQPQRGGAAILGRSKQRITMPHRRCGWCIRSPPHTSHTLPPSRALSHDSSTTEASIAAPLYAGSRRALHLDHSAPPRFPTSKLPIPRTSAICLLSLAYVILHTTNFTPNLTWKSSRIWQLLEAPNYALRLCQQKPPICFPVKQIKSPQHLPTHQPIHQYPLYFLSMSSAKKYSHPNSPQPRNCNKYPGPYYTAH